MAYFDMDSGTSDKRRTMDDDAITNAVASLGGGASQAVATGGVTPLPQSVSAPVTTPAPTTPTGTPNYDGFAAPGYTAPSYTHSQAKTAGWDAAKFNDVNHQTPKYVLGRILSNYPDNPGGLNAAMGDIQKAYPGSTILDGGKSGKINIPGVGIIDVGVSFGSGGGHGWARQTPDVAAATGSGVTGTVNTASRTAPATAPQVMPTGRPAVDGSTTWTIGGAVPSMRGFVYNAAGGYEPGGAGNAVPGMPGATYGDDGYSVSNPYAAAPTPQTTSPATTGAATNAYGFDDPAGAKLASLVDSLVSKRMAPVTAPESDTLAAQLRQALATFQNGGPQQTQDFLRLIQQQIPGLLGPAFDDPQLKQLETHAFDTLDHQRQQEIEATVKAMGARGVPPSSGIVTEAIKDVNRRYDQAKQQQRQALNVYEMDRQESRRKEAYGLSETAASVGNTQLLQGVSMAQALSDLGKQLRGEQTNNEDRAVTLQSIPVELTQQRINAALQALGLSGSQSQGLASTLTQLANLGINANQMNSQNQAASWTSLSKLLADLASHASTPKTGGSGFTLQ